MKSSDERKFIDSIIDFFKKSSIFSNEPNVNVNYLGNKIDDYCLEAVPAEKTVKKFIDGEKEKQKIFVFTSRTTYSQDIVENEENYVLFEELAEWIEEQNEEENYPDISDITKIEEIESIEVMDSPYICAVNETEARYQMEIKITYIQN